MARVLVVDNEALVRAMLADMLRESGYNVSIARSGFEAIEIAGAITPDLVMLEVNMPGLDGWATLEHLRFAHPHTTVLMMGGDRHAEQAITRGAATFLSKPYLPADVLRAVDRAIHITPERVIRRAA